MNTNRLSLRDVEEADLSYFFDHEQDPEAGHMAAFTPEDPSDREAFTEHWTRLLANDTIIKRTIVMDDTVVGHIASWVQEGDREITYWIDRSQWGKGVATTALQLFLTEVEIRPLFARASRDNIGSIRVLEKNGFEVIGEDRGYANARGAEIDELVLSLTTP